MTTWEEQFRRRFDREPLVELIETSWRMKGASRRVLECGIYRTDVGLEVRCGYGGDDLLMSQVVQSVDAGYELAAAWRETVLAKGGFEELPPA